MERLLLHICCAPCATHAFEVLRERFEVTGYAYNPNIHPEEEYARRLGAVRQWAERVGLAVLEGPYEPEAWFRATEGMESEPEGGARCEMCYRMRLERTAGVAGREGFGHLATTLTMGPSKRAEVVNRIGREVAAGHGLVFLEADFKKRGGFQRSLELSRAFGLYRQNYCGCRYSLRQPRRATDRSNG